MAVDTFALAQLERKADVAAKDMDGKTAYSWASDELIGTEEESEHDGHIHAVMDCLTAHGATDPSAVEKEMEQAGFAADELTGGKMTIDRDVYLRAANNIEFLRAVWKGNRVVNSESDKQSPRSPHRLTEPLQRRAALRQLLQRVGATAQLSSAGPHIPALRKIGSSPAVDIRKLGVGASIEQQRGTLYPSRGSGAREGCLAVEI